MRFNSRHDIVGIIGENKRSVKIFEYLQGFFQTKLYKPSEFEKMLELKKVEFDLGILAGYGKILTSEHIKLARENLLTCHGGILPEYRGSSPMNWAIINQEKYFGLTIIETCSKIDGGDIYESARFDITEDDTIADLHRRSIEMFPLMVHAALIKIEACIAPYKQINFGEKYYPLRSANDAQVNFALIPSRKLLQLYKAVANTYHYPWFMFSNSRVEITHVEIVENFIGTPGTVYQIDDQRVLIMCSDTAVWITTDKASLFSRYDSISL